MRDNVRLPVSEKAVKLMVFIANILSMSRNKKIKNDPKGMITSDMLGKLNDARRKNERIEERKKDKRSLKNK